MKRIYKQAIVLALLLSCSASIWAQRNDQAEFLEAKRLFSSGQYSSAKGAFGALFESKVFGSYAEFYHGLSSFRQEDYEAAVQTWESLAKGSPNFKQRDELYFWLTYASFQNEWIQRGIDYGQRLYGASSSNKATMALYSKFLDDLDADSLHSYYLANQKNKELGKVYLNRLMREPLMTRDFKRVEEVADHFNFKIEDPIDSKLPDVRKESYDIAVLLPFLFQSLDDTRLIMQNKLVMELWQGMTFAARDLVENDMPVKLYPFDTKRSRDATRQLLVNSNLQAADLIVGPLYAETVAEVNKFSSEAQVNMFNPLSSNQQVIGDNPFSFLTRPSYESTAEQTARFAAEENDNPYVMIFYEDSERDSAFAANYEKHITRNGFEVVRSYKITKENSRALLDTLTQKQEFFLTQEQADSLKQDPTRFIKSRRLRPEELEEINKGSEKALPLSYDDNEREIVYYENRLPIAKDSIGHIIAATRSNLFANNLISAVETRGDSIKLYGFGEWLDFTMLSFDQLERLQVALSQPDYTDLFDEDYLDLERRMLDAFGAEPSIYHFKGYEIVWYVGQMMHQHGKYFQKTTRKGDFVEGKVFEGYKYGYGNDNQIVPIIRFTDSRLKVVNRNQYENREK